MNTQKTFRIVLVCDHWVSVSYDYSDGLVGRLASILFNSTRIWHLAWSLLGLCKWPH